jgi:hypothetical protein
MMYQVYFHFFLLHVVHLYHSSTRYYIHVLCVLCTAAAVHTYIHIYMCVPVPVHLYGTVVRVYMLRTRPVLLVIHSMTSIK